jgi:hypothetical protein
MPKVPITSYAAEWNPANNTGRVFVRIGNAPAAPVPIDNPEEFILVLLMMSKTGVEYDTVTREIEIPPRPVGS